MKLEHIYLLVILLALALAIPLTFVLRDYNMRIEKLESERQVIDIDKRVLPEETPAVVTPEAEKSIPVAEPAVVPEPRKAPATKPLSTNCEAYRHLVEKYNWNVNVAMKVMQAESSCNPEATNLKDNHGVCKGSFGLFQISCHGGKIYDPASNVAAAYAKYAARGWQPWGVCTSGKVSCY